MLSEKKKAFCREYCVKFDGKRAAIKAGYSKNRAGITSSELLRDPEVKQEIDRIIAKRNIYQKKTADDVVKELELIAFAKTTDFVKVKDIVVTQNGKRRKIRVAYIELTSDLPEETQRAIAEIRQTKEGVAIKTHDKTKALELLGKHHGIFDKDNQQKRPKVTFPKKVIFK